MSNNELALSFKIIAAEQYDKEIIPFNVVSKLSITFPAKKLLSPGIFQQATKQLEEFLQQVANPQLPIPTKPESINKLHAQELSNLAKLVEDGSRIIEATSFEEVGTQTIVLKIKTPTS